MIVQDSFITDPEMLEAFVQQENWSDQLQEKTMWYPGWWVREPENLWERTIVSIWKNLVSDTSKIQGIEYWLNVVAAGDGMQWHFDKDETVYERDGTVISPAIGSVYYPVPNTVHGGYLEIQDESKEIERIAPVFNRMVIFQSDHLHRVSPVYAGPRFVFVTNIWTAKIPEAYQDDHKSTDAVAESPDD